MRIVNSRTSANLMANNVRPDSLAIPASENPGKGHHWVSGSFLFGNEIVHIHPTIYYFDLPAYKVCVTLI